MPGRLDCLDLALATEPRSTYQSPPTQVCKQYSPDDQTFVLSSHGSRLFDLEKALDQYFLLAAQLPGFSGREFRGVLEKHNFPWRSSMRDDGFIDYALIPYREGVIQLQRPLLTPARELRTGHQVLLIGQDVESDAVHDFLLGLYREAHPKVRYTPAF